MFGFFHILITFLKKYPKIVHYCTLKNHDPDILEKFNSKNKIIIGCGNGDYFDFYHIEEYLNSAKERNVFYYFVTLHEVDDYIKLKYSEVAKFFYVPSGYAAVAFWDKPYSINKTVKKHFLSLNNRVNFSRLALYAFFYRNQFLLDRSHFTFLGDITRTTDIVGLLNNPIIEYFLNNFDVVTPTPYMSGKQLFEMAPRTLFNEGDIFLKKKLNVRHMVSHLNTQAYNESFLSIIFETFISCHHPFITEKTWNAIKMKHPFILYGNKNSLKLLQDLGFKTFSPFINEDYDHLARLDFMDEQLILEHIFREIKRIGSQDLQTLINDNHELNEIVEHNYNHLFYELPKIYKNEITKVITEIDYDIQNKLQLLQ